MDDNQFKELLEVLSMRDMLIRIDENTKNARKDFEEHKMEDARNFAILEKSVEKVHGRLDINSAFQNKALGAIALATIVIPIVVAIIFRSA